MEEIVIKFKDLDPVFIIPKTGNESFLEHKRWSGMYLKRMFLHMNPGVVGDARSYLIFEEDKKYSIEFISITNNIVDYNV
jgi:hypothetical protein